MHKNSPTENSILYSYNLFYVYSVLIQEARAAYDAEAKSSKKARLLLTVAVGMGRKVVDKAYEIANISR